MRAVSFLLNRISTNFLAKELFGENLVVICHFLQSFQFSRCYYSIILHMGDWIEMEIGYIYIRKNIRKRYF